MPWTHPSVLGRPHVAVSQQGPKEEHAGLRSHPLESRRLRPPIGPDLQIFLLETKALLGDRLFMVRTMSTALLAVLPSSTSLWRQRGGNDRPNDHDTDFRKPAKLGARLETVRSSWRKWMGDFPCARICTFALRGGDESYFPGQDLSRDPETQSLTREHFSPTHCQR